MRAEEALIRQRANDVIEFLKLPTLPMNMLAIYQVAKKAARIGSNNDDRCENSLSG